MNSLILVGIGMVIVKLSRFEGDQIDERIGWAMILIGGLSGLIEILTLLIAQLVCP